MWEKFLELARDEEEGSFIPDIEEGSHGLPSGGGVDTGGCVIHRDALIILAIIMALASCLLFGGGVDPESYKTDCSKNMWGTYVCK